MFNKKYSRLYLTNTLQYVIKLYNSINSLNLISEKDKKDIISRIEKSFREYPQEMSKKDKIVSYHELYSFVEKYIDIGKRKYSEVLVSKNNVKEMIQRKPTPKFKDIKDLLFNLEGEILYANEGFRLPFNENILNKSQKKMALNFITEKNNEIIRKSLTYVLHIEGRVNSIIIQILQMNNSSMPIIGLTSVLITDEIHYYSFSERKDEESIDFVRKMVEKNKETSGWEEEMLEIAISFLDTMINNNKRSIKESTEKILKKFHEEENYGK